MMEVLPKKRSSWEAASKCRNQRRGCYSSILIAINQYPKAVVIDSSDQQSNNDNLKKKVIIFISLK